MTQFKPLICDFLSLTGKRSSKGLPCDESKEGLLHLDYKEMELRLLALTKEKGCTIIPAQRPKCHK